MDRGCRSRDTIQNVYIARVERLNGALLNVEIDTIPKVREPGKSQWYGGERSSSRPLGSRMQPHRYALTNARRSSFTSSFSVVHIPCGAPL